MDANLYCYLICADYYTKNIYVHNYMLSIAHVSKRRYDEHSELLSCLSSKQATDSRATKEHKDRKKRFSRILSFDRICGDLYDQQNMNICALRSFVLIRGIDIR